MKTFFDCIPCFIRQTLAIARFVTDDEKIHERILRLVLRDISEMDLQEPPPMMGQRIHRLIRKMVGIDDPYRELKSRFNRFALDLLPDLRERVECLPDKLDTAIRLSIAGNVIDFGVETNVEEAQVHEAIEDSMSKPLDVEALVDFRNAVDRADEILFLGDNAGEIVFDQLLLEQLPREKITYVVKGGPIINDATMDDARETGLTAIVDVIDNGSDAPGTILDDCTLEFRERFDSADLIIAKGQGNYETLNQVPKDIFFILKAKCPVIARDIGCEVGSVILAKGEKAAIAI